MSKLNFGTKLLLILISASVISLGTMIFVISSYSYSNSENDAKNYISELTKKNAVEIKSTLDKAIIIANSFASKYESAAKHNEKVSKKATISYSKSVLEDNPFILGIWFSFKDNSMFYEKNLDEVNPHFYTKKGAFQPYVVRNSDGSFTIEPSDDYSLDFPWINLPYKNKRVSITKPYKFKIDGKEVLMTTISSPVYYNNEFIGAVGVDFSLDFFNKNISSIKLFKTGYCSVMDSYGKIISHPNVKALGKSMNEITSNKSILKSLELTKEGKDNIFSAENLKTGEISHSYSYPFEFGNTGTYWTFISTVPEEEYLEEAIFIRNFSIGFGLVVLLVIIVVVLYSIRILNKNLTSIKEGLLSFFSFLNKDSKDAQLIKIDSEDEFGQMAKVINENIEKTESLIIQDNNLIEDVKRVVNEVKEGRFNKKIEKSTDNESLEELKNTFNEMLETTKKNVCEDINKLTEVLGDFSKLDFRTRVKNDKGNVAVGVNNLADIITKMLIENKENGLTLDESSNILLKNVDKLNISSNEAATSLEETAAALEQITSNIRSNTENIAKMANYANDVTKSAKNGENLANQTTMSMDEINGQVNAINEAIAVIDQIAFQTNILSLNAAVEAATAGEAGKGFAVVAQEVRNLASRSAEAAKEIKDLVETATNKANQGKSIASNMIEGYKELNENIHQTKNLIEDIEMSSKEQLNGIEQINTAVNQLDQQTQQNAAVASQTQNIATLTDDIAKLIVTNADEKEFEGKQSVKAKDINIDKNSSNSNKKEEKKESKSENNKEQETWESF
jgi:methyl-accepting chemotaxis protein